ncbi:TetR family transcriptional regulator [Streptomyces sp. SID12488]|uniref:TetR family transcriptional regulator n=1 Tax=Streptomyces sp. SID12488 TaxID=2706040 RepID=UPI0013DB15CF|nr:TetR family transcriptional regulator [Streptomyces sp. SID12488]
MSEAAIFQAGRSAVTERGDSRAIIREIARRAGVARGLVMWNCASKEQLVAVSMTRAAGPVRASQGCVTRREHAGGSTL